MKDFALKKMLEEMDGTQSQAEDMIHNFLCEQTDSKLFEQIMEDNKTIKGAYKYCMSRARSSEHAKNGGAMVPRETVFEWVLDYYSGKEIKKTKKKKTEEKPKEKPITETEEDTQLSLFG